MTYDYTTEVYLSLEPGATEVYYSTEPQALPVCFHLPGSGISTIPIVLSLGSGSIPVLPTPCRHRAGQSTAPISRNKAPVQEATLPIDRVRVALARLAYLCDRGERANRDLTYYRFHRPLDSEGLFLRKRNPEALADLRRKGVDESTSVHLVFFYDGHEAAARVLESFLGRETDYGVRAFERPAGMHEDTLPWLVGGTTEPMPVSLDLLDAWVGWMWQAGAWHGPCILHGWGWFPGGARVADR